MLSQFADNNTGNITPEFVRDFVVSNYVVDGQIGNVPATQILELTDLFIADPGCTSCVLPQALNHGDRPLQIVNNTGADITISPLGADTIDGVNAPVTLQNDQYLSFGARATQPDNWTLLVLTTKRFSNLLDTPNDYTGASAGDSVVVNNTTDALEFSPRLASVSTDDSLSGDGTAGSPLSVNVPQRIITSSSVAAAQTPVALDTPLQIEFGPATLTPEMDLSAAGAFTCNEAGNYRFDLLLHFGRAANPGSAIVYFNILVNGVPVGATELLTVMDNTVIIPLSQVIVETLAVNDVVTFEITRDSTGTNDGGLVQYQPALIGRPVAETAAIIVDKL